MSDEESKRHAAEMFADAGYSVAPILPVPNEKRADLMVSLGDEVMVVEAKSKGEHVEYQRLLAEVDAEGSGSLTRDYKEYSGLSSVIGTASSQLEATPAPATAARVLWLSCLHADWRFVLGAFECRLDGGVLLSLFRYRRDAIPERLDPKRCLYYDPADFKRFRTIDAAILAGPEGAVILVNEFGTRVSCFRESKLYHDGMKLGIVRDPQVLLASGDALAILDESLRDEESKRKYLRDTYGVMTTVSRMQHHKALMSVPRELKS